MNNLQQKILLKSIAGAMQGIKEKQQRAQDLDIERAKITNEKEKTDAYVKKTKADIDFQRVSGERSIAELDLEEKKLKLLTDQFKAEQELRAITIANAKTKAAQDQQQLQLQAAEGRRKYIETILSQEKPGWGDYTLEDAKMLSEDLYGGLGVGAGTSAQGQGQGSEAEMMTALDKKFK